MTTEPSPKQTLILWALLARGGAELQSALSFKVEKKDRDALREAGFITVGKGKRSVLLLEVTDRGWDWSSAHLDAALPSGRNATKSGTPILQDWLKRLQAYMQVSGVSLADVLAPSPPLDATNHTPADSQRSGTEFSYRALREQVRSAYRRLNDDRFGDSVVLSRLRAALPDIDPETFAKVLARMHDEDEGTTLMNLGNPREIETERSSAVRVKGQDMHILWISR